MSANRMQTNMLDGYDWPASVCGLEAPMAVWEYAMALMRQVKRLEAENEELRARTEEHT